MPAQRPVPITPTRSLSVTSTLPVAATGRGIPPAAYLYRFTPRRGSRTECWVEGVAEPIAEEVDAEDSDEDRHPREDRQPWAARHRALRVLQHVSPARRRHLNPEAQEAERGLSDNRAAHAEGRTDDDRRERVREDVLRE